MTRSTSRTTPLSIAAVLLCLLLAASPPFAQTDSQPPQPTAQPGPTQPTPNSQSAPATPQDDESNPLHTASRTELDVVKVLVAQEHAWNEGDIAGYISSFKDSPDTLLIGRDITRGYRQILSDYQHNYTTRASMGNLVYSELQVTTLSDSFAVCTGRYHVDRTKKEGGPADGLFSIVLEKTDQGWKIVLDHTT